MDLLWAEVLAFLKPDESAAEFLGRTYVSPLHTGVPFIDTAVSLRGGHVLEVSGPHGSGKSELLVQIAAQSIMPPELDGVGYGGEGGHAVLLDLDGKFDAVRLYQVVLTRAQVALTGVLAPEQAARVAKAVADQSLKRLFVASCRSSFELLATLRTLDPVLAGLAAQPGGLTCLLLDDVAAHFYTDRAARGAPGGGSGGGGGGSALTLARVQAAAVAMLRALQRRHRLPIVATKHSLYAAREGDGGDGWTGREFMLKPWLDLVTHRLALKPAPPGQQQQRRQAAAEAGPPPLAARWREPAGAGPVHFRVTSGRLEVADGGWG